MLACQKAKISPLAIVLIFCCSSGAKVGNGVGVAKPISSPSDNPPPSVFIFFSDVGLNIKYKTTPVITSINKIIKIRKNIVFLDIIIIPLLTLYLYIDKHLYNQILPCIFEYSNFDFLRFSPYRNNAVPGNTHPFY